MKNISLEAYWKAISEYKAPLVAFELIETNPNSKLVLDYINDKGLALNLEKMIRSDGLSLTAVGIPDACAALKLIKKPGADYVAKVLEMVPMPGNWIIAILENITVRGVINSVEVSNCITDYDVVTPFPHAEPYINPGPQEIEIILPNLAAIDVPGDSGPEAMATALLVYAVIEGEIPVPIEGGFKKCKLNSESLMALIDCIDATPRMVARSIQVIRKEKLKGEGLLLGVLWGTPKLRSFAKEVNQELGKL